ncbi:MAG: ROK family protein [Clostridia bacterium]|nr:ROK family protein [Clostridia bacterium]
MEIIKLCPAFKDYIWGGTKLKEKYGKHADITPLAESWELSFHKDGPTLTENGEKLSDVLTAEDIGENAAAFPFFPLLIKYIDAKNDLSVQIHPSDEYALKHENSFGKTEMWYIVEAEEGAGIYLGFKKKVTLEEVKKAIENNTITSLLNFYKVKAGESYFIPSGTVHAIGKGCLILEIQQNSNLTYRVYDYDRTDAFGNKRELHVEKALKVLNTDKFSVRRPLGSVIGVNKYFSASRYPFKRKTFFADEKSFECLSCVKGGGTIEGKKMSAGDSYFIPAGYGKYVIEGDGEVVVTSVRKFAVGIDLGGTMIKGGIVDDKGKLIVSRKIPTQAEEGSEKVAENIAYLVKMLLKRAEMSAGDVVGIGIGAPGTIDSKLGKVVYSNNLRWKDVDLAAAVEKATGIKVRIANDANVAALGEAKFGAGKGCKNVVMLTLGTGVGGGVIIDGKLFEGNGSAGAELGHMVISAGGEKCTCGLNGCFEAYSSSTALIRETKKAMLADKDSKMWEIGSIDKVNGKTAFDFEAVDKSAKRVVEDYIRYLGVGVVDIVNIFRPEKIIIGGGVSAQKDRLTKPLNDIVRKKAMFGSAGPRCKIVTAKFENKAGILGAAALISDETSSESGR